MPKLEWLDSSSKKENITIIIGKNILLKLVEDEKKREILCDPLIKKFVRIPNLPNKNIAATIDQLIDQDVYLDTPPLLRSLIENKETFAQAIKQMEVLTNLFKPLMDSTFVQEVGEIIKIEDEKATELAQNDKHIQDLTFRMKGQVDMKFIESYEKKLLLINDNFEKATGVKLIIPSNLFVCPKCNARLWDKEITDKKCLSCNLPIDDHNIKRVPVYRMHEKIKNIWKSGLWFEAYLAGLLNKLGYKTWTSVNIMGASGILHEIDVVAIKDGTLLVCECKTGKVSRNDVFNFYTKVGDTKAHASILALIGDFPDPQTRDFVGKNLSIILFENMGETEESLILNELKQRLRITTKS